MNKAFEYFFDIVLPPDSFVISTTEEGDIIFTFNPVDQNSCKKPSMGRSIFLVNSSSFKAAS